ncbi:hypothetical protein QF026_006169 [Streptomyces aurantiacus]|nr:hypothetical protein [Streptomyces aurantiacus]
MFYRAPPALLACLRVDFLCGQWGLGAQFPAPLQTCLLGRGFLVRGHGGLARSSPRPYKRACWAGVSWCRGVWVATTRPERILPLLRSTL